MSRVVTHGGQFHPDELLAISLLAQTVFATTGLPVIERTRDPVRLQAACNDKESFVIDVGFQWDPSLRNFDHHQGDLSESWPDGTPLSSCGLMWRWLREEGWLKKWSPEVLDAMEESLIKPADCHDNGVGGRWVEGELLAAYNRPEPSGAQERFMKALTMAQELVANRFDLLQQDMETRAKVQAALDQGAVDVNGILVTANQT